MYFKISKVICATVCVAAIGVSPAFSEKLEASVDKTDVSAAAPSCNFSIYGQVMPTLALVDTLASHVLADHEAEKFRHSLMKEYLHENALNTCSHDRILSDFRSGFIGGLRLASTQGRGIVEGIATSAETDGDPLTDLTEMAEIIAKSSAVAAGVVTRGVAPSVIRSSADKAYWDSGQKITQSYQDAVNRQQSWRQKHHELRSQKSFFDKAKVEKLELKQKLANKRFKNASRTASGAGAALAVLGYELQSAAPKALRYSVIGRGIEQALQTSSETDTDPLDSLLGDVAKWGAAGTVVGGVTKVAMNPKNIAKGARIQQLPEYKAYRSQIDTIAQRSGSKVASTVNESLRAEVNKSIWKKFRKAQSAATKKALASGAATGLIGYGVDSVNNLQRRPAQKHDSLYAFSGSDLVQGSTKISIQITFPAANRLP